MKKALLHHIPSALRCGGSAIVLFAFLVFSVNAAEISFVGVEPSTGPAFATQNWSSPSAAKTFDLAGSEIYGTAGYYQIRPMPTNTVSNISEGVGAGNNLGITATNNSTLYSAPVFLSAITGGAGTYVNFGGYPTFLGPDGTTIYRQGSLSVSVGNGPFNTPSGVDTGYYGDAFSFTMGPNMGADFRIGIAVDTAATGTYAPDYVSIYNSGTGTVFSSQLARSNSPKMAFFDVTAAAGESFSAAMWQLAGTQSVSPFALITFDVLRYKFDVSSGLSQTNSVSLSGAPAGVLKAGAGTLVIASSNSAAGGALVSDGTLVMAAGSVIGGNITNNSTLVFDGAHGGVGNAVSGAGSLVKSGAGIATFYASNSYTGATVVTEGQIMLGGAGAIPTGSAVDIAAGASINVTGFFAATNINRTIGGLTGAGVLFGSGGTVTVNKASGSDTFSGDIQGGQGLIKAGSGTLVLSGANSYTGATIVNAGTLGLDGSGALSSNTALQVDSGATFSTTGTSLTSNNVTVAGLAGAGTVSGAAGTLTVSKNTNTSDIFSGKIQGGIGVTLAGSTQLWLAGSNNYTGATLLSGSDTVLHLVDGNGLGSTAAGTTVDNGSVLRIQGTNNGGSGITVRAEALTISGLGRAGSGGALRSVSGINTWQGKVTLAADARIGAASGSSLTLDVASGNAIEAANFNLTTEGAGRIQINDAISLGSGGLTKIGSGTLVLSAANTYTGPTSVDVGTLGLHNNSSSLQITVASGASLDLNAALNVTTSGTVVFNTGSSVSVSGTPSGSAVTLLTAAGGISGTPSLVPVAGYSLVTTGNSLILQATAGSTYSAWLGTNASTPQLLQNYAFGAVSPTSAVNTSNLPAYGTAGGLFVLSYSVRADDTNLVVEPQGNEDLKVSGGWTTNGISTSVIGTNVVDGVEMQQRQAAVPLTGGKKFLRLRITE